jgi:hypothetical protein
VARTGEKRNAYKILVLNLEVKRTLRRRGVDDRRILELFVNRNRMGGNGLESYCSE